MKEHCAAELEAYISKLAKAIAPPHFQAVTQLPVSRNYQSYIPTKRAVAKLFNLERLNKGHVMYTN